MPLCKDYNLYLNKHKVRKATMVIFPNGKVIRFIEKLPKKTAVKQALKILTWGKKG